jgi:hypothetical protein
MLRSERRSYILRISILIVLILFVPVAVLIGSIVASRPVNAESGTQRMILLPSRYHQIWPVTEDNKEGYGVSDYVYVDGKRYVVFVTRDLLVQIANRRLEITLVGQVLVAGVYLLIISTLGKKAKRNE